MKLELKSIKYSAFASEETHCYQANLYVDGKLFAIVSNDGRGGPDLEDRHPKYEGSGTDFNAKLADIGAFFKTLPNIPSEYIADGLEQALDIWCGDRLEDWLVARELRAKMRTYFVIQVEGKAGIFTAKGLTTKTDGGWHKGHRILNHMPFDDALVIWKEQAQ